MRSLLIVSAIVSMFNSARPPTTLQETLPVHVALLKEASDLVVLSRAFVTDSLAYMASHGEAIVGPKIYEEFTGLLLDTNIDNENFA
jgi:hypothetical protein